MRIHAQEPLVLQASRSLSRPPYFPARVEVCSNFIEHFIELALTDGTR
jgi:hypothetical protein